MLLLSKAMFKRGVDSVTGDHVLRYRGPGKWTGRLYGYDYDVFFTVSAREVPLPVELKEISYKAGTSLDQHPLVVPFRNAVVDALMAEALVQAPEILSEYVDKPLSWTESMGISLEREHVKALDRIRSLVEEWKNDLQRRIRIRERTVSHIVPERTTSHVLESPKLVEQEQEVQIVQEPEPLVSKPLSQAVVDRVGLAIKAAREAELPQRLPSGMRRRFGKLASGQYLIDVEAKETEQTQSIPIGLEQGKIAATTRKRNIILVDWDGERPVVVRKFGTSGETLYKVEQAAVRAGVEIQSGEPNAA